MRRCTRHRLLAFPTCLCRTGRPKRIQAKTLHNSFSAGRNQGFGPSNPSDKLSLGIVRHNSLQRWLLFNSLIPFIVSKAVLIALLSETLILNQRLASAFILQRRERENRLMSVDAATAAIAHEIKQPLTAISARCSAALRWLKRTPPDLKEVQECLTRMMDASGRANEVVDSIRGLFKTTAHQMAPIEINRLVRQVLQMVENDLHVQGVTVWTRFTQDDLPQVTGDRTLLQQVILNLIKNAIEAMVAGPRNHKGSSAGHGPRREFGRLAFCRRLRTRNSSRNGSHVFDPFFTTKSSGTGLGLSISRKIIADHGGDLRLAKTSSSGCTFEITCQV